MRRDIRPSSISRTLALVPPAVALVAQQASGAFDVFMKMGTISGEVTNKGFEGYIRLDSFQWGMARSISLPSGATTRDLATPAISELTVSKAVDKTSAAIFLNAVGSTPISTVTLVLSDTVTGTILYQLTLSDVLVSSQSHSGAENGDRATENISLNFTKIKIETFNSGSTTATGTAGWDLTKNTKF
jgi:type VI secretion system secreted protein Hcp